MEEELGDKLEPVTFQIRGKIKQSLEIIAAADDRSLASLLRKIVDEWLEREAAE